MKKNEVNATAIEAPATEAKETKRVKKTPAKEMAARYISHLMSSHKRPDIVKEILDAYSVVGIITAVDAFNMMSAYTADYDEYAKVVPFPKVEGGVE